MIHVQETCLNADRGYRYSESEIYETPYTPERRGELFRALVAEWGRCTGKVYVDLPNAPATPVGWVFESRAKYEDSDDTYLRETWVTLYEGPVTHVRPSYLEVSA